MLLAHDRDKSRRDDFRGSKKASMATSECYKGHFSYNVENWWLEDWVWWQGSRQRERQSQKSQWPRLGGGRGREG